MNNYKTVDKLTKKGYEFIVGEYGTKLWYLNGKLHREDGPAYIGANGDKCWYINGNRHREDGPAYIGANGDKEWWINGRNYGRKEPDNWICLVIEYKLMVE